MIEVDGVFLSNEHLYYTTLKGDLQMELTFGVSKQILRRTDTECPVSDSKNYLTATFTFSSDWTGTKSAIFASKSGAYTMVLDDDGTCTVPWEVLTGNAFTVSVFCGNLITTNKVVVLLDPSGYVPGGTPADPTEDIYNQIIDKIDEIAKAGVTLSQEEGNSLSIKTDGLYAPVASVSISGESGNTLVNKADGLYVPTVAGEKGDKGDKGDTGATGTTFTPAISSDGTISWTNDGGKTNPTAVNVKGPKGDTGAQGIQGEKGDKGDKGDTYTITDSDYNAIANKVRMPVNSITTDDDGSVTAAWDKFNVITYDPTVGIDLSLADFPSDSYLHECMIMFTVEDTVPSFAYPSELLWATEPSIETNHIYEISIDSKGLAIICGFALTSSEEETTSEDSEDE